MAAQILKPPKAPADHGLMSDHDFTFLQKYRPQEERWHPIDAVPFTMTPATNVHQRPCINLVNLLLDAVEIARPELVALNERGLLIPGVERFRPIADVAVVVNDHGGSYTDCFFLAAEVRLRPNAEEYIPLKCERSMQHPDNLHVLVISQDERRVEHWARSRDWARIELTALTDTVDLPEFDCRFTLPQLYKGAPLAQ